MERKEIFSRKTKPNFLLFKLVHDQVYSVNINEGKDFKTYFYWSEEDTYFQLLFTQKGYEFTEILSKDEYLDKIAGVTPARCSITFPLNMGKCKIFTGSYWGELICRSFIRPVEPLVEETKLLEFKVPKAICCEYFGANAKLLFSENFFERGGRYYSLGYYKGVPFYYELTQSEYEQGIEEWKEKSQYHDGRSLVMCKMEVKAFEMRLKVPLDRIKMKI